MQNLSAVYRDAFQIEGSLRDIYVRKTSIQDWQKLLDFLRTSSYTLELTIDAQLIDRQSIPQNVADLFAATQESSVTFYIDKEHLAAKCHFFTPQEIEFDIDPRDFTEDKQVLRLRKFCRAVAHVVQKEITLTTENAPDDTIPYMRFDPITNTEEWTDDNNNPSSIEDPIDE